MKKENNLDSKKKFIALYFGQDVVMHKLLNFKCPINVSIATFESSHIENFYLELTPLSQISDEDAIEVARLFDLGHLSGAVKSLVKSLLESLENNSQATTMFIKSWIKVVDYLRSRGYYVGDGTEIEYGWVKLKGATPCK